jgi:hypothetical protein
MLDNIIDYRSASRAFSCQVCFVLNMMALSFFSVLFFGIAAMDLYNI